jgi:hypothetical protein
MAIMAAVCGVMIVLLGVWSTGRAPTDVQTGIEITCLVGGLILCFLAVVLSRLAALANRLDSFDDSVPRGE